MVQMCDGLISCATVWVVQEAAACGRLGHEIYDSRYGDGRSLCGVGYGSIGGRLWAMGGDEASKMGGSVYEERGRDAKNLSGRGISVQKERRREVLLAAAAEAAGCMQAEGRGMAAAQGAGGECRTRGDVWHV